MAVIGKIRQNVGLLIVVIAIAMLAFLLMDVGSGPGGGAGAQGVVGSVDGQDLSVFRYQEIRDNMMSNQTNMNDDQRLSIREQAWNQYIQEVLAKREYQKLGLSLSETELNDRLTGSNVHPSIRQSFVDENGNFSQDQLKAYVASFSDENVPDRDQRRAQWKRFEQGLMQDILRTKYTNLLSKGVYAPSFFAEANNANQSKKANIKYVQIPYDSVEDSEVGEVTASDINKYVAANKAKYDQDEIRTLNYVSFPIVPTAADTAATKEVITSQMANFAKASDNGSFLRRQNSEDVFQDVYYRTGDPLLSSRIKDTLFNMPVGGLTAMYFEQGAYKVAKLVDKQAIPDSVEYRQIVKRVTSAAQLPVAQSLMDSLKDVVA
ncbi:MAG: peptidylprolyl isomerase, partial [Chitinophagales bacterium]